MNAPDISKADLWAFVELAETRIHTWYLRGLRLTTVGHATGGLKEDIGRAAWAAGDLPECALPQAAGALPACAPLWCIIAL